VKKYSGLIVFWFCGITMFAQKFQIGAGLSVSTVFLDNPSFDNSIFSIQPNIGLGGGLFCHYFLSKKVQFGSGINYQRTSYNFAQIAKVCTGCHPVHGSIGGETITRTYGFPLLLVYTSKQPKEKFHLEYKIGTALSLNYLVYAKAGSAFPFMDLNYSPLDTIYSSVSLAIISKSSFSPDLFTGASFVWYRNNRKEFELGISYQHGLTQIHKIIYISEIIINSVPQYASVTLTPRISYLALRFFVYPDWKYFASSLHKK
jgi:hypothetical protein